MSTISNHLNSDISNLKKFIIDNNIVGTSAGVCVALAAKDGIQSLVGDIIIPAIVFVLRMLHVESLSKYLPVKGNSPFKVTNFIKEMITFFLIIIISFVFVKFAFGYLLGVKSEKNGLGTTSNTVTASTVSKASSDAASSNVASSILNF